MVAPRLKMLKTAIASGFTAMAGKAYEIVALKTEKIEGELVISERDAQILFQGKLAEPLFEGDEIEEVEESEEDADTESVEIVTKAFKSGLNSVTKIVEATRLSKDVVGPILKELKKNS